MVVYIPPRKYEAILLCFYNFTHTMSRIDPENQHHPSNGWFAHGLEGHGTGWSKDL
jgi:hypothetical protein